jgi:heme-degrading monooxygenase HmoA
MIERRWRGFAPKAGDDAYLRPFKTRALPELEGIEGFRGGDLLSRTERDSVEYTALTRWDSIEAIRRFAGPDHERALVEPGARAAFEWFDETVQNHEIVVSTPDPLAR